MMPRLDHTHKHTRTHTESNTACIILQVATRESLSGGHFSSLLKGLFLESLKVDSITEQLTKWPHLPYQVFVYILL